MALTARRRLLVWILIGVLALSLIGNALSVVLLHDAAEQTVASVTVSDQRVSFTVRSEGLLAATTTEPENGCEVALYRLADKLSIYAVPRDCTIEQEQILNGRHGWYSTLDQVDDPLEATTVETRLGQAQVFGQKYTECTNSCSSSTDQIALIRLDRPADPEFPVLVVMSTGDERTRAEFLQLLTGISAPS